MKIAAISSKKLGDSYKGTLKNNYLYNGKELFDEGELGWYDYGFRNYDPQIGRFVQLDPLTFKYQFYTPYQFAGCEPIGNTDLDGLEPKSVTAFAKSVVETGGTIKGMYVVKAGRWAGKWAVTGFTSGGHFSKVFTTTGKLWQRLAQASEILGVTTSTVSITHKAMQMASRGDMHTSFRIPDQRQSALNTYGQAIDLIRNDWHPIETGFYGFPEGGQVNWSTGQAVPAKTAIEMTDGPETWLPMIISGALEAKLAAGVAEDAAAESLGAGRTAVKQWLQKAGNLERETLVESIESAGFKRMSPESSPVSVFERNGLRIRLDPPQSETPFNHMHLEYVPRKQTYDIFLRAIDRKSPAAHIPIK